MNILLHIPHTSLKVPKYFYKGLTISKQQFIKYNLEMTDIETKRLFSQVKGKRISSKYSRLFCDVERFKDDAIEPMSQFGEGVVYTHTYDGIEFHQHDEKYKKKVLKYYDQYHKKLDKTAKRLLKKDDTLLIIDCHSFSEKMVSHFYPGPYPDICIGIEENYYNQDILDKIIKEITFLGYTYAINKPYKGSLVPNAIFQGKVKGNVISIMIEVNKKIYL